MKGKTLKMLSRFCLRSIVGSLNQSGSASQLPRLFQTSAAVSEAEKYGYNPSWEAPERDLKNYPLPERPMDAGKVRMGMIPEEFFDAFYPKTGVTGPYCLLGGAAIYALSKEIIPMEHQVINGASLVFLIYCMYKAESIGGKMRAKTGEMALKDMEQWELMRTHAIKHLELEMEKDSELAWQMEGIAEQLGPALKENVELQLEAEFRKRLAHVHAEIKRRLDYAAAMATTTRRIEQEHMVDWIVRNVLSSISAEQEEENLNACIANLEALAAKA